MKPDGTTVANADSQTTGTYISPPENTFAQSQQDGAEAEPQVETPDLAPQAEQVKGGPNAEDGDESNHDGVSQDSLDSETQADNEANNDQLDEDNDGGSSENEIMQANGSDIDDHDGYDDDAVDEDRSVVTTDQRFSSWRGGAGGSGSNIEYQL